MKRIINLILFLFVVAACSKTPAADILVKKMEIDPSSIRFFPGDVQEVNVLCYPENATNLDQLVVLVSNTNVADFQEGMLMAKAGGYTSLTAICGEAKASADITVYSGWFTKGGKKYGVNTASGYYIMMGESTPQKIDFTLTHLTGEMDGNWEVTQSFWFTIPYNRLGEEIYFLEDMLDCQVSVQKNNNEDGYSIYYSEDLGCPVVKEADWGDTDVTLTKGLLMVTETGSDTFSISADFALSNGYTFTAEWQGFATMKTE